MDDAGFIVTSLKLYLDQLNPSLARAKKARPASVPRTVAHSDAINNSVCTVHITECTTRGLRIVPPQTKPEGLRCLDR